MRKFSILLLVGLLLGGLAVSGLAIPLCSYTLPKSHYSALDLMLDYRSFDDQYHDNHSNVNSGSLSASFIDLRDSASYGMDLALDVRVGYNSGELSYDGLGSGSYRMYPAEGDLFGFGSAIVHLSSAFKGPGVSAITGSGYGRFRDVTPLAKALKIGNVLLEMGSLTGPLPDETLTAIAQEIGKRVEYPSTDELIAKIAELVEGTGLVAAESGKLGASAVLKIAELIEEAGYRRLCGWDVRGGIGYELIDPLGGPQDFLAFAGLNYALATAPDIQVLFKLDFTSSFKIFEEYSLSGLATYIYRVNPTMSYSASYTFLRTKGAADEEPVDSHTLGLEAVLHLSTGWSLTADFNLKWESDYEEWSKELSLTANYSLF